MSALSNAMGALPDPVFADLLESDEEYLLVVDLPGVAPDGLDVGIDGPRLHIEARREKDLPGGFRYHAEDRPLFLDADLPVPPDADGEGASGSLDRGVLELRLPKRDRKGGQSIPIAAGESSPDRSIAGSAES